MIKILLVDDNIRIRKCLRDIISDECDMQIIGEAEDGADALIVLANLEVDIIILDVSMKKNSGFYTLEQLRHMNINLPVLMLSFNNDKKYCIHALKNFADAYIDKANASEELILAIRQIISEKENLEKCEVLVNI